MYGFSPDCSVLYNGPKGKENREGDRRIEKKEENKGEDQTDVIDMSRSIPPSPPLPSLACARTHTHHTRMHARTHRDEIY